MSFMYFLVTKSITIRIIIRRTLGRNKQNTVGSQKDFSDSTEESKNGLAHFGFDLGLGWT